MWSVNYGNSNALYSNWTILLVVIQSSKIKTAKVNGFAMIFEKFRYIMKMANCLIIAS